MKNDCKYKFSKSTGLNKLATARILSPVIFCFVSVCVLSGCGSKNIFKSNLSDNKPNKDLVEKMAEKRPVKILFVGDMMFDRSIRQAVERRGGDYSYAFEPVKDELSDFDVVVGNLEGPIADKKSVSVGTAMDEKKNLVFSFDPAVAKALSDNNLKLVDLGNNHILNQGADGLAQTEKYLGEAGVQYFGDTGNGEQEFAIREMGGMKIGFVSYNYSVANSFEKAVGDIKNIRDEADFVIVCPHWGTEYKTGDPGLMTRDMAHKFADAGADSIIGGHPHVVENFETYNGKKIYYSLGNFVFDQYFSPDTMRGLGVGLTINPDGRVEYNELKFVMNKRGQTELSL